MKKSIGILGLGMIFLVSASMAQGSPPGQQTEATFSPASMEETPRINDFKIELVNHTSDLVFVATAEHPFPMYQEKATTFVMAINQKPSGRSFWKNKHRFNVRC